MPPSAILIGRGKTAGFGKGQFAHKRQRKLLRDCILGVTKSDLKRLARRGGVRRIAGGFYEEIRGVLKAFLERVIRKALHIVAHSKRSTIRAPDIVWALKLEARPIYGFEEPRIRRQV